MLFASIVLVLAAQDARAATPMPDGPIEHVTITLERSMCFGSCPDYKVELRGDGAVRFTGQHYTLVRGTHETRVAPDVVKTLVADFRSTGFWALEDHYYSNIADIPAYTLTLTIGGRTKKIDYDSAYQSGVPGAVRALDRAIDTATGTERWIAGDDTTLAALRAEAWDFKSPETARMLAVAAAKAPEALVLGLIDAGAPLNGWSEPLAPGIEDKGPSALGNAAVYGRKAIVRRLLDAGARVEGNTLHLAVGKGDPEVVGWLLSLKPDVNARDYWGAPPLFRIPDHGMAILRMLLAAGADVRATNPRDETVLHRIGNGDLARALIAAGADIEARDSANRTPLFAISSEDVALSLLDAGARIEAMPDGMNKLKELARIHQWSRVMARLER